MTEYAPIILVVDDLRRFVKPVNCAVVYARSSEAAITWLELHTNRKQTISQLWLDYDLGDGDDARAVVDWIDEHRPKIGTIYAHTMNPAGAKYIITALADKYPVYRNTNPHLIVPRESQSG